MKQEDIHELLELAALAAGVDYRGYENWYEDFSAYDPKTDCNYRWNPLEDDGDALRLAVKIELDVMCGSVRTDDFSVSMPIRAGTEIYAATRYAIVRAAAEIGKSMKVN